MGFFDDLDKTDGYDNSKYFKEGRYLIQLARVQFKRGHKGESFIIEGTVLGSISNDEQAPQVGQTAAHVWKVGDYPEMARHKWISFLVGVTGMDQSAMTGAQWSQLSSKVLDGAKSPLAGTVMYIEATEEDRSAAGKTPLTHHKWHRRATAEDYATFGLQAPA